MAGKRRPKQELAAEKKAKEVYARIDKQWKFRFLPSEEKIIIKEIERGLVEHVNDFVFDTFK